MTADARVRTPARRRRSAAAVLAALSIATLAQAAGRAAPLATTPDFTASIPVTPTDWSPGFPAGVANPLMVPKFDPSLGTLTSVNVRADYQFQNDFSMTFVSPSTITVSATQAAVTIERPDRSSLVAGTLPDVSKDSTIGGPPFPKDVTFPTMTRTGTTGPVTMTDKADLALFTATAKGDKLALPAVATSHSSFSSTTGNGNGMVNTRAGVNLIVSYTYTPAPVPEPSGLAVLGCGLLVLLSVRRARAGGTA